MATVGAIGAERAKAEPGARAAIVAHEIEGVSARVCAGGVCTGQAHPGRRWLLVAALPALPRTPSGGGAAVGVRGSHPPRSIIQKRPWGTWWLICWIARELALREAVVCANLVRGWTSLTVASAHEAENERDKERPRRRPHSGEVGTALSLGSDAPESMDGSNFRSGAR